MVVVGRNLGQWWEVRRGEMSVGIGARRRSRRRERVGKGFAGERWGGAVGGSQGNVRVKGLGGRRRSGRVGEKGKDGEKEKEEEGKEEGGEGMGVVEELKMPGDPYGVEGTWLRVSALCAII